MMSEREHMSYMGGGVMAGYPPGYSVPARGGGSITTMSGYGGAGGGGGGDPSNAAMYGAGMGGGALQQQQQQAPMGLPTAHHPPSVGMPPQGGSDMSSMMSQFSVQHQQLVQRQQGLASGQQAMGPVQHGLGSGQQRLGPTQISQLQAQVGEVALVPTQLFLLCACNNKVWCSNEWLYPVVSPLSHLPSLLPPLPSCLPPPPPPCRSMLTV